MLTTRQRGLSLVELLVGVAIALVLIAGASVVYVNSLRATTTSSAVSRVNQDLRAIMSIIENDLHRAGFWAQAAVGQTTNPFMVRTGGAGAKSTDIYVSADRRCVLYTFDLDLDGTVDANEFFGFRFDDNTKQLMVLDRTSSNLPDDTSNVSNCAPYAWVPMNFPATISLSDVTFGTGGSQCIAFDPATFNPASAPGVSYTRWRLDPSQAQANYRAGCDTTNAGVPLGTPLLPASAANPSAPAVPSTQTRRSEVRQIIVSITATHTRDSAAKRTIESVIRLRNDRMM